MPVHNIFPTPVYAKQLLGSKQGEINQELYSVYKPEEMVKNTCLLYTSDAADDP